MNLQRSTSYEVIRRYLPPEISSAMGAVAQSDRAMLSEVRLRCGRPAAFTYPDGSRYLTHSGRLTMCAGNTECITVRPETLTAAVDALCSYSVHSRSRELREGWFVLPGGVRVGVTGTTSETAEGTLRDYSSLNFRIAREVRGCAEDIFRRCGREASILISGGVNSGKTTVLRDLCRLYGSVCKTALIDERNEIAACSGGLPTNDVGALTDVLTGCSRSKGIVSAVRTMSPEMIFCDEIAASEDAEAILSAHGSGVRFAATIHAGNFDELMSRNIAKRLIGAGVFTHAVILRGSGEPSAVAEIRRLGDDA